MRPRALKEAHGWSKHFLSPRAHTRYVVAKYACHIEKFETSRAHDVPLCLVLGGRGGTGGGAGCIPGFDVLRGGEHCSVRLLTAGYVPVFLEPDAAGPLQPPLGVGAVHEHQGNGVSGGGGQWSCIPSADEHRHRGLCCCIASGLTSEWGQGGGG